MKIPRLELSFGQLAWTLCMGQAPSAHVKNRLNYLRQLGIPFERAERARGSGNRIAYAYEDLLECGVGLFALEVGMKPKDIQAILVERRTVMQKIFRRALREQPEAALTSPWVKSRGRIGVLMGTEIFLRLHDRYSSRPGAVEVITPGDAPISFATLFDPIERLPDGNVVRLAPLTRLALQWVAWALEAPVIRTGPRG